MFNWFTGDRQRRLQRAYAAKLREARLEMTLRGDRLRHAELVAEAREIARELEQDCVPLV